jgi:hypothetical protein
VWVCSLGSFAGSSPCLSVSAGLYSWACLRIPAVAVLYTSLFAGRGLSVPVGVATFLGAGTATFLWISYQPRMRQQVRDLPPRRRRSLTAGALLMGVIFVLLLPRLGSYPAR